MHTYAYHILYLNGSIQLGTIYFIYFFNSIHRRLELEHIEIYCI